MPITFGLLGLSIFAALPPSRHGRKQYFIWSSLLLLAAASAAGLYSGYLTWYAIIELVLLGLATFAAGRKEVTRAQRILYGFASVVLALAFALHLMPGFRNPVLIANIKFSADAVPFTQYANFDKAAVGLFFIAFLCRRADSVHDWEIILRRTLPIALMTTIITLATATAIGYVKPDIKYPSFLPIFFLTNLLFTCAAEEAFFRGFLQDRLAKTLSHVRHREQISVLISAALFGLAHAAGGPRYVMLATISGLGCAYAYSVVQRIEAPIITHFTLNAAHFVGFTYPQLQQIAP